MFGFYLDLPAWLRTTIAAVMLLGGIGMVLAGYADRPQYTYVEQPDGMSERRLTSGHTGAQTAMKSGMVISVVGAVLLVACGKSDSEKNGYNF